MIRKSLALVLLLLVSVTVGRCGEPPPDTVEPVVSLTAFPSYSRNSSAGLQVEGVWQLRSPQQSFGGFSALALADTERLRLFSDYGTVLDLPLPRGGNVTLRLPLARIGEDTARKSGRDIEAATSFGSRLWLALENRNAIVLLDDAWQVERATTPEEMADWPANSGPEALARLADGRFLVLREGEIVVGETDPLVGALFGGDPTEGASAQTIAITGADGYHPVDAATAPDGRILVLLRRLGIAWPFDFRSRLAWLDPADLDDGAARLSPAIDLSAILPRDNYEGLAVRAAGARWDVWLVSDDNNSHFQASWLAHLSLDPAALPD
jgi:hypothetical protein